MEYLQLKYTCIGLQIMLLIIYIVVIDVSEIFVSLFISSLKRLIANQPNLPPHFSGLHVCILSQP